jgi:hypothetical protein
MTACKQLFIREVVVRLAPKIEQVNQAIDYAEQLWDALAIRGYGATLDAGPLAGPPLKPYRETTSPKAPEPAPSLVKPVDPPAAEKAVQRSNWINELQGLRALHARTPSPMLANQIQDLEARLNGPKTD